MKNRVHKMYIVMALCVFVNAGCFTSSNFFKSARSLGTNDQGMPTVQFQAAAGGVGPNFSFVDIYLATAVVPETLEVDFNLNLAFFRTLGAGAGVKYSFIQNATFAAALYLEGAMSSGYIFSEFSFYLKPALLFTFSPSPDFSFTLAPRAIIDITDRGNYSSYHAVGITTTLDFGREVGILPEIGLGVSSGDISFSSVDFRLHWGIGVRFGR